MQGKRKDSSLLKILLFLIFFSIIYLLSFYTYSPSVSAQDSKELDSLEERVFHQSYNSESKEERISRLENFLFGKQNSKDSIESRIIKITTALKVQETKQPSYPIIKPELFKEVKEETKLENNEGIIGAINQIEIKMFNMTFNEYPFTARINALEDRLLQKNEITQNKMKPLLERVTILVKKAGILEQPAINNPVEGESHQVQQPSAINNQLNNAPKSYSIDPSTGLLINDQTGETVKDSDGNPISVMIPQPKQNYGYQLPQNPLYQNLYGNPLQQNQFPGQVPPGQLPYDFLFNQGGGITDPGY